jgi:hypothetical protein
MSPRLFALVVACIVGLALLRFAEAGYLFSTLSSEAEMEQQASDFVEQLRPHLPTDTPVAEATIHHLSLSGEQRMRQERRERAFANLQSGLLVLVLLSLLVLERRAGQAAIARASAASGQGADSVTK